MQVVAERTKMSKVTNRPSQALEPKSKAGASKKQAQRRHVEIKEKNGISFCIKNVAIFAFW